MDTTMHAQGSAGLGDLCPEDFETFEDAKEKLEDVERELAKKLNLPRSLVRRRLFALDRCGRLVEDELVSRWHEAYSNYVDWVRNKEGEVEEPPRHHQDGSEARAAEAALAVL